MRAGMEASATKAKRPTPVAFNNRSEASSKKGVQRSDSPAQNSRKSKNPATGVLTSCHIRRNGSRPSLSMSIAIENKMAPTGAMMTTAWRMMTAAIGKRATMTAKPSRRRNPTASAAASAWVPRGRVGTTGRPDLVFGGLISICVMCCSLIRSSAFSRDSVQIQKPCRAALVLIRSCRG